MSLGPIASFVSAVPVTPSDTVSQPFSGLYIGTTGAVAITTTGGQVVTFASVPVGFFYVSGARVMATGTAASNIIALE